MQNRSQIIVVALAVAFGSALGLLWIKVTQREPSVAADRTPSSLGDASPRASIIPFVAHAVADPGTISGRVVDSQQRPIAGAHVCAVCASCDPSALSAQHCVRSAEDGSFIVSELRTMAYRLMASAQGFSAAFAQRGQPLLVDATVARTGVEIVLDQAGVELSGQVLDATGGPIPGAKVQLVRWQQPPLVAQTEADEDGRFSTRMPAGNVSLNASADGYASSGVHRVAPSRDIEIMLTPGASVRGFVVIGGDRARPVVGAEVNATAVGSANAGARAHSAADGSFWLAGLEPANYVLSASGPGFRGYAQGVLPVALAQQVQGVTISVMRQAQVSGTVLIGAEQAPCLEGTVTLGPRPPDVNLPPHTRASAPAADPARDAHASFRATIGAGGAVQFDAVPAGRYFAGVNCRGYRQQDGPTFVEVDAKDVSGLVWRVGAGLALAIRVVDQAEQPVSAAQVFLDWPARDDGPGMTMSMITDAEGKSETPASLLPGVYHLRPGPEHAGEPRAIALAEGMGRVEAVLKLQGSAALSVSVQGSDGTGLDGLTVVAYKIEADNPASSDAAPARAIRAVPKGSGLYRAGALAPGRYRVEVTDAVNPPREIDAAPGTKRPLEVAFGQTTVVSVSLARKAQIKGLVIDAKGAPASDVWVSAANEAALAKLDPGVRQLMPPARRVLTESDGRFVITGLDPAGTYSVRGEEPDGSATHTLSDVRAGSEAVTLTLAVPAADSADGQLTSSAPTTNGGRTAVLGM
jgi:Carboxypeptidase regulatory-like domain